MLLLQKVLKDIEKTWKNCCFFVCVGCFYGARSLIRLSVKLFTCFSLQLIRSVCVFFFSFQIENFVVIPIVKSKRLDERKKDEQNPIGSNTIAKIEIWTQHEINCDAGDIPLVKSG